MPERSLRILLGEVGFTSIVWHGWTGYRTSALTQGAVMSARAQA